MPASPGLINLYRLIEAGEVEIAEAPEPAEDALPALGIFFGPQPGWSREREGGTLAVEWACDLATREVLVVDLCRTCLSGFGDIRIGHRTVCGGCLRSSQDGRIRAILAKEEARREADREAEAEAGRAEASRRREARAARSNEAREHAPR